MNTKLVFDTAYVHSTVPLVIDEHRETAAVTGPFFGTCQYQVQVGVTVGDETLHAIQSPAVFRLVESGFEHHALEVGAGIRLREVH